MKKSIRTVAQIKRLMAMSLVIAGLSACATATNTSMTPNSALLTDAYHSALRAARGAAKRGR